MIKIFNKNTINSKSIIKNINNLISILILICVLILYLLGLFSFFENKLQDMIYQGASITSTEIHVIGINEETLQDRDITVKKDGTLDYGDGGLGQFQTWTRADISSLINKLNEDPNNKPAAIGVDILFSGQKTPEEDKALVEAARNGGNVVVGVQATFGTKLSEGGTYLEGSIKSYEEPFSELRDVVDIGHINTIPDSDAIVRKSLYTLPIDGKEIPSFSTSILKKYNDYWGIEEDIKTPPLNENDQWYITYSGEPGDYYGSSADGTSFIRVLNGEIDPTVFAGSIVLIGPYSFGMMDSYYTPISTTDQMHGVEIHANIIQALMEENYKKQASPLTEVLVILTLGIFCIIISKKMDMKISAIIIVLTIVGYIFLVKLAFGYGLILTIIYPVFLLLVMYIAEVGIKYILERKEKQKIKGIFKKYVDPKLVDSLILSGDADSNEVGKTKDISVLFVDVRGFTPISEKLKDEPETIVKILNEYLELTSQSIFNNGGSVDKFIGDATMALFNGFVPLDDYEYKSVCAAWDIVKGAEELNNSIYKEYGVNLGFGVGVNCGNAVVGNLGPSFRKDFTAIGDTVNTAARLESNAKAGRVLIGSELYNRLKNRITVEEMGEIPLKGKSIGLMVYELVDINAKN